MSKCQPESKFFQKKIEYPDCPPLKISNCFLFNQFKFRLFSITSPPHQQNGWISNSILHYTASFASSPIKLLISLSNRAVYKNIPQKTRDKFLFKCVFVFDQVFQMFQNVKIVVVRNVMSVTTLLDCSLGLFSKCLCRCLCLFVCQVMSPDHYNNMPQISRSVS